MCLVIRTSLQLIFTKTLFAAGTRSLLLLDRQEIFRFSSRKKASEVAPNPLFKLAKWLPTEASWQRSGLLVIFLYVLSAALPKLLGLCVCIVALGHKSFLVAADHSVMGGISSTILENDLDFVWANLELAR